MADEREERLQSVVQDLSWLSSDLMLFGAGILPLYIDRADISDDLRPTEDVDALVGSPRPADVHGQIAVGRLEQELRDHGWAPDLRPHRRNQHAYVSPSKVAVDFVFEGLYPPDDWAVVARKTSVERRLSSGVSVRIPTPAMFLVCKVAASRNPRRWDGAYDSHDLEDVAALMAGCEHLEESIGGMPRDAAEFLASWAEELLGESTQYGRQAHACLEGNWPRSEGLRRLDELLGAMAKRTP